jgi:hypothetical protein
MSSHKKAVRPIVHFKDALAALLAAAKEQWGKSSEAHFDQAKARYTAALKVAPPGVFIPPLEEAGLPVTRKQVIAVFEAGQSEPRDEYEDRPIFAGDESRWQLWLARVEGLLNYVSLGAGNPSLIPSALDGLSKELRRLLTFLLIHQPVEVEEVRDAMEHTDNSHTHIQLSRLRRSCGELLRRQPLQLVCQSIQGRIHCELREKNITKR